MIQEKERKFFIVLGVLVAISILISFVTFAIAIINVWNSKSLMNNVFEIIYMAVHLIIAFFTFIMILKAVKAGSFIMKELMYNRNNHKLRSKTAAVIALIFFSVFLILLVYSFLCMINVPIPRLNFPFALFVDIFNVGLLVCIVSIAFYIYPFYMKEKQGE